MATPAISNKQLRGTGYKQLSIPRLTPEQMQLLSQGMGAATPGILGGIGQLGKLASGDQSSFEQLEAPALRQFQQNQGGTSARFGQLGQGAQRSSGFQHAQNAASQELASSLSSQRMGLQQSAIQQLMSLYGSLIGTETHDTALLKKKKPWWQELFSSVTPAAGQAAGLFGGLGGAKYAGFLE